MVQLTRNKLDPRFWGEDGDAIEFETQSFGNSEVEEEAIDPRWAALKDLKK